MQQTLPLDALDRHVHRPLLRLFLRQPSLSFLLGLGVAVSYALFGLLAALRYPTAYSPLHNNTLSQLGNHNLNPHGATLYLIGCALAGTTAIAFFASLVPWRLTGTWVQNHVLLLVQVLGAIGGLGLVMNAVYPENQLALHHFWAGVVFNCLGAAMLLAPVAFWRPGRRNVHVAGVAFLGWAAVIVMFVFARFHWVEWLPVTLFLVSAGLLGFHTRGATAAASLT